MKTQDNKKISQIASSYVSKPESNMKIFNKEALIRKFQQETEPREFFDSYKILYWIALLLSFVFQAASAVSSYRFIDQIYTIKISQLDFRLILVIASLAIIEIVKYYLFSITLQKAFTRPRQFEPFLILATLAVSSFSFYASISGGGQMGINPQKEKFTKTLYEKKIGEIKTQIHNIQTSESYKKVIWIGNGQTALVLTPEGLDLIKKRESEISDLKSEQKTQLQKINQENHFYQKTYEYTFGTFEVLFILCQLFIWHFKRSSAQDREITEKISNPGEAPENQATSQQNLHESDQSFKNQLKALEARILQNDPTALDFTLKHEPIAIKKVNRIGFKQDENEADTTNNFKAKSIFEVNLKPLKSPVQSHDTKNEALQSPVQSELESQIQSQLESKFKADQEKLEAEKEEFEAIKEKFEATVKQLQIKSANYLKKYEATVKLIMQRETELKTDSEIKAEVIEKFNISEGTYYNIKRILNNPTK